jgi:hypothetical protein
VVSSFFLWCRAGITGEKGRYSVLCTRFIYGIDGIDGENREEREFKELRERLSLNSLNSLNSLISYFNQHTDFSSERCSSGADMKKVRMGCTKAYCSFGLLIEASLMRCYQEKFLVRMVQMQRSAKIPTMGCTRSTAHCRDSFC